MSTKQSGPNEQVIQAYFETLGWTVAKLSAGKKGEAADFRVCQSGNCFLCEVKTIESARANFPYTPIEYYREQKQKRKDEIERWMAETPDTRPILRKDEGEFMHEDEAEFLRKYGHRRRNTQYWFQEFARTMKRYFTTSSTIKDLPYILRLDSQDLYRPTPHEQDTFFKWLEGEIQAIDRREPSRRWHIQRWPGNVAFYSTFYQIHQPSHSNDTKAEYQLLIVGPRETDSLEVHIHSYGTLNLDRITSNVEDGLKQLESSASREVDQQIPRVVVLGFKSGVGFEWKQLLSCITYLLREHPDLSAIAVLRWTPDGTPPPQTGNLLAWLEFFATTPAVPSFVVYHNSWLQDIKQLPVDAFNDKWSVQFCPVRW
jgi:hypothetical protein